MVKSLLKWIRISYKKTTGSIAFIPGLIAIVFLLVSFALIYFDFSEAGKDLKSTFSWLSLRDASTARSMISAIAAGIISLTVFSFSMVMILLNQAASQMSNRILDKLIGNRFQQIVLGFYIGTIVYALFLLSTIRDINSGIYVPSISTYLLIALTIVDIFLFIYFLHYITSSVKYETIIHRICHSTMSSLQKSCILTKETEPFSGVTEGRKVGAYRSGIFQGFQRQAILDLCKRENIILSFLYPTGTFILEDAPLLMIKGSSDLREETEKELNLAINIHGGQDIATNYYYGFRQLMEIAVKALSPGINDPGTAVLSLQALGELLAYRSAHSPEVYLKDSDGSVRIIAKERTFNEIFEECVLPIWDYGKTDRRIQHELLHILSLLNASTEHPSVSDLLQSVQQALMQSTEVRS